MAGRGNSTDVTDMDLQQLQSDTPLERLERYNAEMNRYQENFYVSESSTSQQLPEPEMKVEHQFPGVCSDSRSVTKRIEILKDRIHRQKMADKVADIESVIWLDRRMKTLPQVNQIRTPLQADLQVNTQNINNIDAQFKDDHLAEYEMMKNFLYEKLNLQLSEDSEKASLPTEQNEDYNVKTPRKKDTNMGIGDLMKEFASAYPWLCSLDQGHYKNKNKVSFEDLENQLYDENNNKVSFKDFEGLEEALKKTNVLDLLPDYLKPIATQIEKARGKATGIAHEYIQLFVCAAIKEMQHPAFESLNWDTLKKWGATLNYARQHGFQVTFADNLLRKNFATYIWRNFGFPGLRF